MTENGRAAQIIAPFVVVLVLLCLEFYGVSQAFTGDEPRYAFIGLGLYSHFQIVPTQEVWERFLMRSNFPIDTYPYAHMYPGQSLLPGAAYGAALLFGNLKAARLLNIVPCAIGLFYLTPLVKSCVGVDHRQRVLVSIAVLATVALSLPFIAFVGLMYPEVMLFAGVAAAMHFLAKSRSLPALAAAGLLPMIHARALPLSIAFLVIVMIELVRSGSTARKLITHVSLYAVMLAFWAFSQSLAYGSLMGPVLLTRDPSPSIFLDRVCIQLYDVRHGLFAYSPIYILAIAGLVAGSAAKHRVVSCATILLCVYFGTFLWSSADESWTARYWVAALPLLACGLAYWASSMLRYVFVAIPFAAVTVANTILFYREPSWFLDNRTRSVTYAEIGKVVHVDVGRFLPVDNDYGLPITPYTGYFLGGTAVLVGVLALAAIILRRKRDVLSRRRPPGEKIVSM